MISADHPVIAKLNFRRDTFAMVPQLKHNILVVISLLILVFLLERKVEASKFYELIQLLSSYASIQVAYVTADKGIAEDGLAGSSLFPQFLDKCHYGKYLRIRLLIYPVIPTCSQGFFVLSGTL